MRRSELIREKVEFTADLLAELYGTPKLRRPEPAKILDVLIATKLSQNTTDKSSYKAFTQLRSLGSWEEIARTKETDIRHSIKVCGLANTKAKDIKIMLGELLAKFGTLDLRFMRDFDNETIYKELLSLRGIGVKTASCVLVFALGRDVFPVDTHVHRVLNRLGIAKTSTAEKTFSEVSEIIPEGRKYELHTNLIKFGRNICRAVNPHCSACGLYEICTIKERKKRKSMKSVSASENNFLILEEI